jgi:YHS domain-containing protein
MFRHLSLSMFLAIAALCGLVVVSPVQAADEIFVTSEGAIHGYDPVAYHTQSKAVPGKASFTHRWNGATWRFASRANRNLFAANPARYAPRYGGFCAYGTSRGYKVSSDPQAFAIVEGKLYLNYNKAVQTTWNHDRTGNILKADEQWKTLEHTAYEAPNK